jgi:hypothetical protein
MKGNFLKLEAVGMLLRISVSQYRKYNRRLSTVLGAVLRSVQSLEKGGQKKWHPDH